MFSHMLKGIGAGTLWAELHHVVIAMDHRGRPADVMYHHDQGNRHGRGTGGRAQSAGVGRRRRAPGTGVRERLAAAAPAVGFRMRFSTGPGMKRRPRRRLREQQRIWRGVNPKATKVQRSESEGQVVTAECI